MPFTQKKVISTCKHKQGFSRCYLTLNLCMNYAWRPAYVSKYVHKQVCSGWIGITEEGRGEQLCLGVVQNTWNTLREHTILISKGSCLNCLSICHLICIVFPELWTAVKTNISESDERLCSMRGNMSYQMPLNQWLKMAFFLLLLPYNKKKNIPPFCILSNVLWVIGTVFYNNFVPRVHTKDSWVVSRILTVLNAHKEDKVHDLM